MLKKRLGAEAIENRWLSHSYVGDYFKISSSLIIPGSVEEIGDGVFIYCSKIEKVVISEGVKVIRNSAFAWCSKLREVEIPGSVEEVESYAFEGCREATIIFKKPQKEFKCIRDSALWDCKNVKYAKEKIRY